MYVTSVVDNVHGADVMFKHTKDRTKGSTIPSLQPLNPDEMQNPPLISEVECNQSSH